jgi:predicted DNA repair protein MutK
MASGIFAILDDVAVLLDDAAVMSKVAAKKTAGLLGDDLAVNAEKATGFHASRELPVLWAITKGSFLNKLIILPLAFLLSAFMPGLIVPILLLGGAYLSYEGAEKVLEWMLPHKHAHEKPAAEEVSDPEEILQREAAKIKSAVRTDFILSIEIIIISLDVVIEQSLPIQILVVSFIALVATVGVYGLVALLVRMDDTGSYMIERARDMKGFMSRLFISTGNLLITSLPKVIRLLSIVGTIAMLLVGGGMYVHNIEAVHHLLHDLPSVTAEFLAGLVVGLVLVAVMHVVGMINSSMVKD